MYQYIVNVDITVFDIHISIGIVSVAFVSFYRYIVMLSFCHCGSNFTFLGSNTGNKEIIILNIETALHG